MATATSITFKVETPKNLDGIFSLECFKYREMQGVFHNIYDYLSMFGLKMEEFEEKFKKIPDFSKVMEQLSNHEKLIKELGSTDRELRRDFEANKIVVDDKFKVVDEANLAVDEKCIALDKRVTKLEELVDELQKRPVSSGEIDYSLLCMKTDFEDLEERVKLTEKRNIE